MPDDPAFLKALNDENFRSARESLKANESIWSMQLGYIFGHPADVSLDFDSLNGDFALVQPFIHQGLTGALMCLPKAVMEHVLLPAVAAACKTLLISASHDGTCAATFDGSTLHLLIALKKPEGPPPIDAITASLGRLNAPGVALPDTPPAVQSSAEPDPEVAAFLEHEAETSPTANTAAPATGDPYARAATFMRSLETAMRLDGIWPGEKPAGEIEVRGAFGCENMAFSQWLAWVLIPRVNAIVEQHGRFPGESNVASYAIREFDGQDASRTHEVLYQFDDMINHL